MSTSAPQIIPKATTAVTDPPKEEQWDWKILSAIVPIVTSAFAFAFEIGYFYSIDIGWFSLFSLSEHTEFALRAFPIAIAASVAMLISMHLAQHQPILAQQDHLIAMMRGHDAYSCVYGNSKTRHVVKQITLWSWIVLLVIAGAYVGLFEGYLLLMLSVFTLAVGTHSYFTMHGANKYARLLYWSITLMICTFALGFLIPRSWYFEYQFSPSALLEYVCPKPSWCSGFASKQMTYSIITLDDDTSVSGQLMHPGDANVLFYQYDGSKASTNGIRLLRRDKIKAIRLCKAEIFAPAGVCLRGM
jgi:hypothetical protein